MKTLSQIISNLEKHPDVDSVFLTGSQGIDEHKPYSDIDLVVILQTNKHKVDSLYTWIDRKFSDIFFFDHSDLQRINDNDDLDGNSLDAIFLDWLKKGTIRFDKTGRLTELKNRSGSKRISITSAEKQKFWQKINYNFVANSRYFQSDDPVYHEALEIRLLYGVSEILCGYFEFRNIPWRGEKAAVKYLHDNDEKFYGTFVTYTKAGDLKTRFQSYKDLASLVFTEEYKFWQTDDVIPQSKENGDTKTLVEYWGELTN